MLGKLKKPYNICGSIALVEIFTTIDFKKRPAFVGSNDFFDNPIGIFFFGAEDSTNNKRLFAFFYIIQQFLADFVDYIPPFPKISISGRVRFKTIQKLLPRITHLLFHYFT